MRSLMMIALLFSVAAAHGQMKGFSLGPYAETAWPAGSSKTNYKNGIGAGLGADIRLGKLGLTGSAGFMHFGGKRVNVGDGTVKNEAINAIPVRAGLKYRLAPTVYAKLEGGMAKFTNGNESAFIFAPGLAVRLFGLELQAKYERWNLSEPLTFWGVKAGFNF